MTDADRAPARARRPRPPLLRRPVGGLPLAAGPTTPCTGTSATSCGCVSPPRGRRPRLAHTELLLARPRACAPRWRAPLSIISMDDPEHTRQRRLDQHGASRPRQVARARPTTSASLSDEIIDEIADARRDRLRRGLRHPRAAHRHRRAAWASTPTQRQQLYRWSDAMMAGDGHIDPDDPVLHGRGRGRSASTPTTCVELIEERRGRRPRDDLIRILTGAFDEGALARRRRPPTVRGRRATSSTDDELIMFLVPARGGRQRDHPQRASAAGSLAFSRFPEQSARLLDRPRPHRPRRRRDRALRVPGDQLHAGRSPRTTTYTASTLQEGDKVLMLYQSANRDEDGVRRPRRVPDRPRPQPAPRLRHRHPLLPRRQPGPGRDRGGVRGAVPPPARHPGARRRHAAPGRLDPRARPRAPARGVHPGDAA